MLQKKISDNFTRFMTAEPKAQPDVVREQLAAIFFHLKGLLNTRKGSITADPNYGVLDLQMLYQGLPGTQTRLIQVLICTIERYEPRLQNLSCCLPRIALAN